jgi:hypothetical protein
MGAGAQLSIAVEMGAGAQLSIAVEMGAGAQLSIAIKMDPGQGQALPVHINATVIRNVRAGLAPALGPWYRIIRWAIAVPRKGGNNQVVIEMSAT